MAVEARPRHDRDRPARGVEHDAVFAQVEFERAACRARSRQRVVRSVKGCDGCRRHAFGRLAKPVTDRLRLFIGQAGSRTHQAAHKAVATLMSAGIDDKFDRETGAVDRRLQRAKIVRQRLRQHRHDPVGEIDRVAAAQGFTVEGAARSDIPGDIGDRDNQAPTSGIGRVPIGFGPHRIIEIARVAAVDRDQRQRAQIGPARGTDRCGRFGLRNRRFRELIGNAKGGDRQPADHAGVVRRSEPIDDPRPRSSVTRPRQCLGDDQFAVGRRRHRAPRHGIRFCRGGRRALPSRLPRFFRRPRQHAPPRHQGGGRCPLRPRGRCAI